jgi:signal transduction histidine kinase
MNTVTPIISLSDTLLKNSRGEQRDGLNVINRTGKELITFVENYRKFTHVPTPRPALFYVKPFLVRMAGLAGPLLPPESRLELSVEPQDLLVYADEGLIARVVTNLLKNAAEAISPQGYISIRSYSDEHEAVVIDISNNGPLIPDDVASHIFIPFFSTKSNGSGIGLSISRQIMRLSNGSITLVSDREAGLTTFRLTFN